VTWLLKRLFVVLALAFLFVTQVAAVGNATSKTAYAIVAVIALILPFLPFKQLPFKGPVMVLITYGASLVLVVIASFVSGDLQISSFSDAGTLLAAAAPIWAITQGVYGIFKDNPIVGPYLK
jgi:hypothetical protein